MRSLPLFHRIAGEPVIVLGEGPMAEPKRRLVERAGAVAVADIEAGIAQGARLAFVALESVENCEKSAQKLKEAGLLVNVVDRPDLCDFTTPSILERDPVLLAIGTSGASAGLAKQLRLRLEALLPQSLGRLAAALQEKRAEIRQKFPLSSDRRQALDQALGEGGMLDPLDENSVRRLQVWLDSEGSKPVGGEVEIRLLSDDPEELTLRQIRLLGSADIILFDEQVPQAILNRARADARRIALGKGGQNGTEQGQKAAERGLTVILRSQSAG
ncbi:siroheme synthase [Altericroceibacterium spongiae]|uniref:precorrin-2 dehydrogenase n=1 Tax=Altericroceibacterium spongiae TaxID=2320269 RepID=A0A420EJY9_9SPHN|nr:siroheme synthase [Altericroceibacterium spongiae]RKF20974.1 siroheme synthase [Altericroceibacterium spongiae]